MTTLTYKELAEKILAMPEPEQNKTVMVDFQGSYPTETIRPGLLRWTYFAEFRFDSEKSVNHDRSGFGPTPYIHVHDINMV